MVRSSLAVLLLMGPFGIAKADWIDPDTPTEAHTTYSIEVKDGKPPGGEDVSGASSSPSENINNPTPSPSEKPSASPTMSPTISPLNRRLYKLVMSDEFDVPGREFGDGKDPKWTALDKNDYTNDALHYYAEGNVRTNEDGELVISTEVGDTDVVGFDEAKLEKVHEKKHFRSAMLQSWNKFCFTGGIVEAEITLPGKPDVGGLWPAFWLLGNLARHTYVGSSMHIWPWSSNECNDRTEGGQQINACLHSDHWGMKTGFGRGAPEIDIFEVQPGPIKRNVGPFHYSYVGQPFMSSSYQVAPGRAWNRPGAGYWPGPGQWYDDIKFGNETCLNILFYGNYNHFAGDPHPEKQDYWSDSISYNRQLHQEHFTSKHVYRLEWEVPDAEAGHDGYLHWFLDGKLVVAMNGTGITNAGFGAEITSEPMYILMNTAISTQWGFPTKCPDNCPCETYDCGTNSWAKTCGFSGGFCEMMKDESNPIEYKVNWVRVYQDPNDEKQKVGCSTPERPTKRYIEAHADKYKRKEDKAPLKKVMHGGGSCEPSAIGEAADSCGGEKRGTCKKRCECNEGWTGPHCLVPDGSDPIDWEKSSTLSDLGFQGFVAPPFMIWAFGGMTLFLLILICYHTDQMNRKKKKNQYTQIHGNA